MNKDVLESQWTQIREILREKFSSLTEEDIRQINGRYDQLVAKLQQKYGYSREEAEDRIRSWNFDRFSSTPVGTTTPKVTPTRSTMVHEDRVKKDDDYSSLLKWVLGLGIPLLLLGAYFLSPARTETPTTQPNVTQERVMGEAPADLTISNGIRNALISQQNLGFALQNVQITTHNGVVTLSGTVPNTQIRDSIVNTAQNFSGVRQVINNLQVR